MANTVLITARPPELAPGLLLTGLLPAISVKRRRPGSSRNYRVIPWELAATAT
jgi:hypothetical protein